MNAERSEAGQAFPLAIASLFILALLFAFLLRSSERLIQRERVRARADVTAISAGIGYSRGLNLVSLSQKAAGVGVLATALSFGALYPYLQTIQRFQKNGIKIAPWVNLFSIIQVADANELVVLPVWNRPVLFGGMRFGKEYAGIHWRDLVPNYNVVAEGALDMAAQGAADGLRSAGWEQADAGAIADAARSFSDGMADEMEGPEREALSGIAKKLLPSMNWEPLLSTDHYEYTRKDGTRVKVEKEHGSEVWEKDARGKPVRRYKTDAKYGHRYARAVKNPNLDIQVSLKAKGPHVVTLLAVQRPKAGANRPGWVSAISQVQVAGGNLELTDLDAARYGPTLVPVRLFDDIGVKVKAPGAGQHAIKKDVEYFPQEYDLALPASAAGAILPALEALGLPDDIAQALRQAQAAVADFVAVRH